MEWLEQIQTHWQVKRLKRLFRVVNGSHSGFLDRLRSSPLFGSVEQGWSPVAEDRVATDEESKFSNCMLLLKALVTFSGAVRDGGADFTEANMNGFPEAQTAEC